MNSNNHNSHTQTHSTHPHPHPHPHPPNHAYLDPPHKVPVKSQHPKSILLSREELLSFSSDQFEELIETVAGVRELSTNEKNEIKRQRRLIKNRESAQASRQRKKTHIYELEKQVRELTEENEVLKTKVAQLTSENSHLKGSRRYEKEDDAKFKAKVIRTYIKPF
uniref:BZIP domain-containing protein n=1 Tax=Arcella intermedia TaxID=1963864 RepID=A0A6B2LMT8_9EUKA